MVHVRDVFGIQRGQVDDVLQRVAVLEHILHVVDQGSVHVRREDDLAQRVVALKEVYKLRRRGAVHAAQITGRELRAVQEHGGHVRDVLGAEVPRQREARQVGAALEHAVRVRGIVGLEAGHVDALDGGIVHEHLAAVDAVPGQVDLERVGAPLDGLVVRVEAHVDALREVRAVLADLGPAVQVVRQAHGHEGPGVGLDIIIGNEFIPKIPPHPRRLGRLLGHVGAQLHHGHGQAGGLFDLGGDVAVLVEPHLLDGDDAGLLARVGHAEAAEEGIEEAIGRGLTIVPVAGGRAQRIDGDVVAVLGEILHAAAGPGDGDLALVADGHGVERVVEHVVLGGDGLPQGVGAGLQAQEVHRAAGLADGGHVHGRAQVGRAGEPERRAREDLAVGRVHLDEAKVVERLVDDLVTGLLVVHRRVGPGLDDHELHAVGVRGVAAVEGHGHVASGADHHAEGAVRLGVPVGGGELLQLVRALLHVLEPHAAQAVGLGELLDGVVVVADAA